MYDEFVQNVNVPGSQAVSIKTCQRLKSVKSIVYAGESEKYQSKAGFDSLIYGSGFVKKFDYELRGEEYKFNLNEFKDLKNICPGVTAKLRIFQIFKNSKQFKILEQEFEVEEDSQTG